MDIALKIIIGCASVALVVVLYIVVSTVVSRRRAMVKYGLSRSPCNPILSPYHARDWEAEATFNPGAVLDDAGNIHIFYRAITFSLNLATAPLGYNLTSGWMYQDRIDTISQRTRPAAVGAVPKIRES